MGQKSVFSKAGTTRTDLVAVRPNLRPIEIADKRHADALSQDGETEIQDTVDDHEEFEDDDEAQEPNVRRAPKEPTKAERERHEALHLPYRSWCRHCV